MSRLRILLVDDDPEFRRRFEAFGEAMFDLTPARSSEEAWDRLREDGFDAVLLDVALGAGDDGIDLLRRIRAADPDIPVVMVSGDDRPETVVRAMKAGANDYVTKHPNLELLDLKLRRALGEAGWRSHARAMQQEATGALLGSSAPMARLREEIARIAPRRVRVLIRGESGSGKELVARGIHHASARRAEKFVVVSGAVGTDDLADADLFGHERGAFTGADRRRRGKFELADGGTLFLDEIGKASRARQSKLLRVIETGRFERLGGSDEIVADVRLVAASNEDLPAMSARGAFLHDLYHRLAEYELAVPPLRERVEDLPLLVEALATGYLRSEGLEPVAIDDGAVEPLAGYAWPGNVRELDAVVKRAVIFSDQRALTADDFRRGLRAHLDGKASGSPAPGEARDAPPGDRAADARIDSFVQGNYQDARRRIEAAFDRLFIEKVLARSGGNVSRAAQALGVSRATLHRRIHELGLRSSGDAGD